MRTKIIIISLIALISAGVIGWFVAKPTTFGGHSTYASHGCTTYTVSAVHVGSKNSNGVATILSAYSNRAWARIQLKNEATSTVFLSFDEGENASLNNGLALGPSNQVNSTMGSTTPNFIDFGLNTDFPYVGAVKGINTSSASSSILVTECRY